MGGGGVNLFTIKAKRKLNSQSPKKFDSLLVVSVFRLPSSLVESGPINYHH